jgi:hypothetical protein
MPQVPDHFPASIDGRPYVVSLENYQRISIEKVRQQADGNDEFGESSLNPFSLWRRSQDDWSGGAGQEYLDKREDSLRRRFYSSSRLDPWERGTLRLASAAAYYGAADIVRMGVADGTMWYVFQDGDDWKLFVLQGESLESTGGLFPGIDVFPDTDVFPEPSANGFNLEHTEADSTAVDACSDGIHVYVLDEDGVKVTDTSGTTPTVVNAQTGDKIAYVRNRLMLADGYDLYNIESDAVITQLTPATTVNAAWTWDAFGESTDSIYVAGHSGDRAEIYRITVEEDGVSLEAPVAGASLPYGERCVSLYGYVGGVMVLGTTEGFRVATNDGNGNLFYGPAVDVGGTVSTMTAFGRWVYFGGYSTTHGFIGRINLGLFVLELQPAWSIDLFDDTVSRTVQGTYVSERVQDLVITGGRLIWRVEGSDDDFATVEDHIWYEQQDSFSPTGQLTSGKITYDLADSKVVERIQVLCDPLISGESIQVYVSVDGIETLVGTINTVDSTGGLFQVEVTGETAEYRIVVNRSPEGTTTPVIQRVTLGALPIAQQGDQFQLPLILREAVWDMGGREYHYEPDEEFAHLKMIERAGVPVTLKLWGDTYRAVIDQVQWGPELDYRSDQRGVQGTCTVVMRTFDAV